MKTKLSAAVLGFVLVLVAAGLSIANSPEVQGCTTDSECERMHGGEVEA